MSEETIIVEADTSIDCGALLRAPSDDDEGICGGDVWLFQCVQRDDQPIEVTARCKRCHNEVGPFHVTDEDDGGEVERALARHIRERMFASSGFVLGARVRIRGKLPGIWIISSFQGDGAKLKHEVEFGRGRTRKRAGVLVRLPAQLELV